MELIGFSYAYAAPQLDSFPKNGNNFHFWGNGAAQGLLMPTQTLKTKLNREIDLSLEKRTTFRQKGH
jgi:hypothetical protein